MIQILRNGGIGGIFLGFFLLVLSKMFFEAVPDFPQVTYTPLFTFIKSIISSYKYLEIILGVAFVLTQAGLLTYFLHHHKVIKERSLFPFILYVMLAIVYNEQFYLNPASFLNFFLILILDRLLKLRDSGKNPGMLFLDIGTLLGISFLLSKEAMFYVPFILIGVIIIYNYSINNLLILLLSIFMVIFVSACIYFLLGKFSLFAMFFNFTPLNLGLSFGHWQERFYLYLILLVLISLFSYYHFQFSSNKISNKSRRFAWVFGLLWMVGILIVVFQKLNLWYNMALVVIPITTFATNYFQDEKGKDWFKNLLFLILILGLMSIQINY